VSGSVLNHATPHSTVWGAGISSITDGVPPSKIHAVRGPISRARAASCGHTGPIVYGDPGLLLPRFHKPQGRKDKVAIVPHYVDFDAVRERYGKAKDVRVVNVLAPIEEVLDAIGTCEHVISSSLHGLVVAAAYGLPFEWVQTWRPIHGDGTKFRDFGLSVGLDLFDPIALPFEDGKTADDLLGLMRAWKPVVNVGPLWDCCPLR
jgi:pyruvyltransferase